MLLVEERLAAGGAVWTPVTVDTTTNTVYFGNGADTNFSDVNPRHQIVIAGVLWMGIVYMCLLSYAHYHISKHAFAVKMGFFDTPQPVTFQLYSEICQKFRLSAQGLRVNGEAYERPASAAKGSSAPR